MTNLLREMRNWLQFAINVNKSHRQPHFALQLVCEKFIITFLYTGSSIQNASGQFVWCIQLPFVKLCPKPHKQIWNAVRSGDSNSCSSINIQNQCG